MSFILAAATPEYAGPLFEAVRESIAELYPWMDWCGPEISQADIAAWLTEQVGARASGRSYEYLVLGRQGEVLGSCGLNQVSHRTRSANLGYWTRSSRTGMGLATEAARQVVSWAFANTDLARIEILAAVGNHASQRVAERAGAVCEGVMRKRLCIHDQLHDAVVYSFVRSSTGDRQGRGCSGR